MSNEVLLDRDAAARAGLVELLRRFTPIPFVVAPLLFATLGVLLDDGTLWRRVGFVLLPLLAVAGLIAVRRGSPNWARIRWKLATVLGFASALCALSGGLESPFVVVLAPMTLVGTLLLGPRSIAGFVVGELVVVWAFAFLATHAVVPGFIPEVFGGDARGGHSDALIFAAAGVLTFALPWVTLVASVLRATFLDLFDASVRSRDEAVRAHAEHAQALTAMSAEIAHELKNPLASVKGLAALIARELGEGKAGDRLAVLRREVDRMQATLDEFLNFSRPLLPLNLKAVDLRETLAGVAALHEGLARERGVTLHLAGDLDAEVVCDPRKVGQVIVNLVQNAIEASPSGAGVELVIQGAPAEVRVEVRDRGRGLDPAVQARVFEPGVTTKEKGSGLGLSIARGLARQHGGELELVGRPGGGASAVLRLPRAPQGAA